MATLHVSQHSFDEEHMNKDETFLLKNSKLLRTLRKKFVAKSYIVANQKRIALKKTKM
jgi:hypothetical protein